MTSSYEQEVTHHTLMKMKRDQMVWLNLHDLAYNVIVDPPKKQRLYKLLEIMPIRGMTCKNCRAHYREFISKYCLEDVVSSRDRFAKFLLEYHNSVNKSIDRPEFSTRDAEEYYITNRDQVITQIKIYGLTKTLGDFYSIEEQDQDHDHDRDHNHDHDHDHTWCKTFFDQLDHFFHSMVEGTLPRNGVLGKGALP